MITCADAALALCGRGPPAVPRRISLVTADWAAARRQRIVPAAAIALRNVRRLIDTGITIR